LKTWRSQRAGIKRRMLGDSSQLLEINEVIHAERR
jgi:hypothetical protein